MTTPPAPAAPPAPATTPAAPPAPPPPAAAPPGRYQLAAQLRLLGVRPGQRLLVHAALGGTGLRAGTLRDALLGVLGPRGTLVVPAFTAENSLTSTAHLARVAGLDEAGAAAFRARMEPFDPALTPSQGVGVFAEVVRTTPGAARSGHPQTSFAALGADAHRLCAGHRTESHLGEDSPLGKLCWEGGQVLMINVGFSACTAFHLAEYRIPKPPLRMYDCVVKVNLPGGSEGRHEGRGGRSDAGEWKKYEDVALDDGDFEEIGRAFPDSLVRGGRVGGASALFFSIPHAVDHAQAWMTENRR
ncbi:AAC(3) family N-acetyltransferase [Streptomyces sp. NPDC047976]|uniref:aminoglycoside N(3)-acetyltransferase n=1 Tax=Streptomyces sp. NPDC047976 TaxID=3155746 RepID=UPI003431E9BF